MIEFLLGGPVAGLPPAILLAVLAPLVATGSLGVAWVLTDRALPERAITRATIAGLLASVLGNLATLGLSLSAGFTEELYLGSWLSAGAYEIPLVFRADEVGVAFASLASALTVIVAWFSRTYLHNEHGFTRFFVLLGLFATGTQLVAYAGALDLLFAGWELIGIASTLFIGFFHEREQPIRSSMRALVTYRLCDAGFLLAVVSVHEWLGSTRLSALSQLDTLTTAQASIVAALFLLAAAGKSAQLPFSGWLPRAMEGPTPSSALFYGGVSIHVGLFLMLRIWPVLDQAPLIEWFGVALGLATAVYAVTVAPTHTDAKGALAHATLAQVGIILAEIALGWNRLALVHLVGHALLRVWQYLHVPNVIHDAHRLGHGHPPTPWLRRVAPRLERALYASALHRLRLDDLLDAVAAGVLGVARGLQRVDRLALAAPPERPLLQERP